MLVAAAVVPAQPATAIGSEHLEFWLVGPIRKTLNPQGGCIIAWKVRGQEYGKRGVVQLRTKGDLYAAGGLGVASYASSRWKMSNRFEDDARSTRVTWGGQSVTIPPGGLYDLKITLKGVRSWRRLSYKATRRYRDVGCESRVPILGA